MTKRESLILAGMAGAAFVLAFMVTNRLSFRLDLTRNKANTISEVSLSLFQELTDPVRITYYLSSRLEQAHPLPGEIADLLAEYAARSGGMVTFQQRAPEKTGLEEMARLGIAAQQIQVVERNEATVATVYTGVLIEYLDRREVLPVVFSLDTLEYDLTSRIRAMVRGQDRELGVLLGDPAADWETGYTILAQELTASGYTARLLSPGEEIPPSLPALFVLGNSSLFDDWALYRIDRYLQGGGRALFAVDGVTVDVESNLEARAADGGAGIPALLARYGVTVRPVLTLDQAALNAMFQEQTGTSIQYRMVRYPEWVAVLEENGNPGHPLTAQFAGLDLYWASPLDLAYPPAEGVEVTALFTTTAEAWLQTASFYTSPDMIALFSEEAEETRGIQVLGAALAGTLPGAFAGREKPSREGSSEELPDMPAAAVPARIIVVGDADFAGNFMQATSGEDRNLDFLLKAADWLASDDDLLAIRGREAGTGRLDRIQDVERRQAAMNFAQALSLGVVPALVIAAGLLRAGRRRRRG